MDQLLIHQQRWRRSRRKKYHHMWPWPRLPQRKCLHRRYCFDIFLVLLLRPQQWHGRIFIIVSVVLVIVVDNILLPIRFSGNLCGIFGRIPSLRGRWLRGAQEEEEEEEEDTTTTTTKTNTTTFQSLLWTLPSTMTLYPSQFKETMYSALKGGCGGGVWLQRLPCVVRERGRPFSIS